MTLDFCHGRKEGHIGVYALQEEEEAQFWEAEANV